MTPLAHEVRLEQRMHGGDVRAVLPSRDGQEPLLDFSQDSNPLGAPSCVRSIILRHLDDVTRYPDPHAHAFREAAAAYHRVSPEHVLPGNGTAELIAWLVRLRPLRKALVLAPTFIEYAWAAAHAGAAIEYLIADESTQFQWDLSEHAWSVLLHDVDMVFLCNPNNPTGTTLTKDQVLAIAERCERARCLCIVDEAFVEWLDEPGRVSIASDIARWEHVVVLRSLTKLFAVPGLRLGYLLGSRTLVQQLRALQPAWPLNTFALALGPALFEETDYVQRSRAHLAQARDAFLQQLRDIPGLRPFPSMTNFLLCRLNTTLTALELAQQLAARGVLVRVGDNFAGLEPGRFIRLAIRTREENARCCSLLREVLAHAG